MAFLVNDHHFKQNITVPELQLYTHVGVDSSTKKIYILFYLEECLQDYILLCIKFKRQ